MTGRNFLTSLAAIVVVALLCSSAPALAQAPLTVGEHYAIDLDSERSSAYQVMRTERGRVYEIHHPGATYLALHFERFDLAAEDRLIVSDTKGEQRYVLRNRGKMEAGTFWAQHVKGDTVVLEYVTSGRVERGQGFVIDQYAAGYVDLNAPEAICGTDDKENAVCYQTSNPAEYAEARAVARLLISGSSLCTGWLASADNHLVTNEHCISSSTAALNTDYELASEAPDCGSTNCQLCHAGDVYSGATFIQDNPSLDYALVQITSGNPAATYGFLEIDDRPAVVGERIYIPQHPGGRAKELGIASTHAADGAGVCQVNSVTEAACSGVGYNDVGYFCDTEGGSSGSPVLAASSNKVIALHHCRGSLSCTNTGGDPNRGVPITLVCDEICGFLGGPQCLTDADCDDGDPCTQDTCNPDGTCSSLPLANCCGNGSCEVGEDCVSCAADCVSGSSSGAVCGNGLCEAGDGENCLNCAADCNGAQNGRPANRFCCGDGGGENPVDCTDARCTTGSFQCTNTPQSGGSFCCGDGLCDSGEGCSNCGVDCNIGFEICGDGSDNDCNGLVDCDDPVCAGDPVLCPTCGGKNSSCNVASDCCSGVCKRNGRCA